MRGCKFRGMWATSNGHLDRKGSKIWLTSKRIYIFFFKHKSNRYYRSGDHFHTDTLIHQRPLLCNYISNRLCFIDLKAKTHGVFYNSHNSQVSKAFLCRLCYVGGPWRAECWGPCRPLPESTEHLLPTAVRAAASWWRHRGTLCPPQCVTSIPGPWTKPQASRMGLACLLMLFSTSHMWRACGPRAECHRLATGTNGPGFSRGQAD